MTYTSHADLGGRDCRDPVIAEPEGLHWHATWEPRALAVTLAMGATGAWNIDMSRSARETLPDYAQLSYYEIWLAALCRLMLERGLVTEEEMNQGQMRVAPRPLARVLRADAVAGVLARGSPTMRDVSAPARFHIGDRVRTRAGHVDHHTRLPGYAADRVGSVERVHGVHVFADAHAQGLGEQPEWLYSVAFEGRELWGNDAAPGTSVAIDLWEEYLEGA
jgi:nitrile hydratase